MTLFAEYGRVFTGQHKSRQHMIKRDLFKLYRFRIFSQMFFVAVDALLRFKGSVVTRRPIAQFSYFRMTSQAFLPADFIAYLMA
jgi:hypothetical protein